ncbi:MAG: transposase [Hyphomonadaceae bacterium]
MMGHQEVSAQLFYAFQIEDHVPSDHILRRIDAHLDLESVRSALKPYYSNTGRPSIDPDLMMRMLIIGSTWKKPKLQRNLHPIAPAASDVQ